MSSVRIVTCVTLVTVVVVASLGAQEPRTTIGPLEQKSNAITPQNPVPMNMSSATATYPPEARAINAAAMVTLVATLNQSGRVAEIRKLSRSSVSVPPGTPASPNALRAADEAVVRSATAALQQWRYESPANAPISFTVSFYFTPKAEPTASPSLTGLKASRVIPAPPVTPWAAAVGALSQASARGRGQLKPPTQINKVQPVYPPEAQREKVQGVVMLEALIGADGKVADARIIRSVPMLDQASLDTVRQWEYMPALLDGVATPIVTIVYVTFNIQ